VEYEYVDNLLKKSDIGVKYSFIYFRLFMDVIIFIDRMIL